MSHDIQRAINSDHYLTVKRHVASLLHSFLLVANRTRRSSRRRYLCPCTFATPAGAGTARTRRHGFDGVGVDAIMTAPVSHMAGSTVIRIEGGSRRRGGNARAGAQSRGTKPLQESEGFPRSSTCRRGRRANRTNGCAVAASGADLVRQGAIVRRGLTVFVRVQLDLFIRLIRNGTTASQRKRAMRTLLGCVCRLILQSPIKQGPQRKLVSIRY